MEPSTLDKKIDSLAGSYPLSPPFPFDHNYTCRRVKWGEHGGMRPLQHSLTTAPPFKSQKILFKARAPGSNLIHRRLSTSQLPILDLHSPVTWFTSLLSRPPTPYALPSPRASRGSAIHVFLVWYIPSVWGTLLPVTSEKFVNRDENFDHLHF